MISKEKLKEIKLNPNLTPVMITGIVFALISLYFVIRILRFVLLPKSWRLMLGLVVFLLGAIFLLLSYKKRKKKSLILMIIEIILSVLMLVGSIALPAIEKKIESIFSGNVLTDVQDFHVYTFIEAYRLEHKELGLSTPVSNNLLNYLNATFLYPKSSSPAQVQALDGLTRELGGVADLQDGGTLWETMHAFYDGEAECVLLSDMVIDMLEETEEYGSFIDDTIVLTTIRTEVDVETEEAAKISEKAFTVFVAGNDTRSGVLSIYGRTDVDILLTVNPETAQALIISIPRDTFLPNPAINYVDDKLTHLGNDGITNTMKGLSNLYDIDIPYYAAVNFNTFKVVVDTLGGIDINNPYAFQGIHRYFNAGELHLNGEDALDYVRERHTLANGDFGRNEHQAIVLRAILQKLTSRAVLEKAGDLITNLSGSVATNVDPSSILELAAEELENIRNWNIIYYHLGGYGTRDETASMPGMQLYVAYPINSQIAFVKEEVTNVLTGEILEQKELPDDDQTHFEEN